jgi:riboflavin biosynthesis pyrimidine reductase
VILTRVFPATPLADAGAAVDLTDPGARDQIAELYRPPRARWTRLNLVGTLSGSAVGPDGTSESITTPTDRAILRAIRGLADVVLVGASSVRAEPYFAPKHAAFAIVTRSGDFSARAITQPGEHGPVLVLCPESAVALARETISDPDAQIIPVADVDGTLSAAAIIDALREAGYASVVAEGGPALAAHLVTGGVVDELCLTTSPVLNGATLPLFGQSDFAPIPLGLTQLLIDDDGVSYARWSVSSSAS